MEQEIENDTPIESATQEQPTESQEIESKSENVPDDKTEDKKMKNKNPMQEIEIEKMVLHCGGTEDKLEKSIKLLEMITGSNKIYVIKSTRRIPTFGKIGRAHV